MAAGANRGWPETSFKFSMVPDLLMTAASTTEPWIRVAIASGGYFGSTLRIRLPCSISDLRNTLSGVFEITGITGCVPDNAIGRLGPSPMYGPISGPTLGPEARVGSLPVAIV